MLQSLLVGVGIHRTGGVSYDRKLLEEKTLGDSEYRRWETEKTIRDAEEFSAAENLASSMRRKVGRLCTRTSFGFVLAADRERELDELLEVIRDEARAASLTLRTCSLSVSFVKGRIASSDTEAARAMVREVNVFLADLKAAIDAADAKLIREVLASAKGLDQVLAPDVATPLQEAIQAARAAAKLIIKEVVKKGEDAADVLASLDLGAIESARMLFLELDNTEAVAVPAVDASRFASVDV